MIIIAVLGAVAIMLSLVLNFAHEAAFNNEYLYRVKDTEKAYYIAVSTLPSALSLFQADDDSFDAASDAWAGPFPPIKTKEGKIYIQIEDEDRYFNPNFILTSSKENKTESAAQDETGKITEEKSQTQGAEEEKTEKWHISQFERLLNLVNCDKQFLNKFTDWLDKDSQPTLPGGYEDTANAQNIPRKNARMDSIYELLLSGAKREDFYGKKIENKRIAGLNKLLTAYSDGKVNINTADKTILKSIDETITDQMAETIIKRRAEKPFKDIKELVELPGLDLDALYRIEQLADVKSKYYNIKITVQIGETKPVFTCVVKRDKGMFEPVIWKIE